MDMEIDKTATSAEAQHTHTETAPAEAIEPAPQTSEPYQHPKAETLETPVEAASTQAAPAPVHAEAEPSQLAPHIEPVSSHHPDPEPVKAAAEPTTHQFAPEPVVVAAESSESFEHTKSAPPQFAPETSTAAADASASFVHSETVPQQSVPENSTLAAEPAEASAPSQPARRRNPLQPVAGFTHTYNPGSGADHADIFSQPILFAGPLADSDPFRDGDSAIESYASTKSVSLEAGNYEYRHEHGRRYHALGQGTDYLLPNGMTLNLYMFPNY